MDKTLPNAVDHQEYQIKPMPMKIIVEGAERWNSKLEIWKHSCSESTVFQFCGKPTFKAKEEAIKYCFNAGKHIIDNEPEKLIQ